MKKYEFKKDVSDRKIVIKEYFNRLKYPVDYHFTKGRLTVYDCIFYVNDPSIKNTKVDKDILMEIKSRNCLSTKYPTTFISEYKYNALIDFSKYQPVRLLVLFHDCMYLFMNVKDAFVGFEKRWAPDADINYNFQEKEKPFASLDMKKGIRIEYSKVVN